MLNCLLSQFFALSLQTTILNCLNNKTKMNIRNVMTAALVTLLSVFSVKAMDTSVAGFFQLANSGRVVYNFNEGWRFLLGDDDSAWIKDYDDNHWQVVTAPHTLRLEAAEASGGRNYQGVAWYRKYFIMPKELAGKDVTLYFEAIMGKQTVWVDGNKVTEHFGGYLPIIINLTELGIKPGEKHVIAVKTDNSDDKNYPPGKKQSALDFCYHGGMYRDVWLIGKSDVAITDAVERGQVAGGGVFLHYDDISDASAKVMADVEVGNKSAKAQTATVMAKVKDKNGNVVATMKRNVKVAAGGYAKAMLQTLVKRPNLWSPESPYLYNVELSVVSGGKTVDGGIMRMGIRKAEFRGKDGFWLNGKPYHQLVGGNRHQDFAYIGNAVPNSQQWRDAKRLRDAGMTIIRAAHYPQDDSFMDACDELGLFIIVPTPGWQYWNKEPKWGEMVHENTRLIIRRDRNHTSVLMWEPILNETRYPEDFALKALEITREEFPYPGRPLAAADMHSAGVKDNYDVLYGWQDDIGKEGVPEDKCIFTREFGEIVDDWYAHNCINRASRSWGERPMLIQAHSLAKSIGEMYHSQRQFIGGCLWHPFDHQRGYHPDPYFGGIYDAFRQKKYAFEMFRSQLTDEPMVFIANEMMPFSDNDVTVFSNCDSVRLTLFEGDKVAVQAVAHDAADQPNRPLVFKDFWNQMAAREYSYKKRNWQRVSLVAEGIKNGKVVATEKKMPSRRSTKIRLYADAMGRDLVADGSDIMVIVAEVTDDNGNVRRLAKDEIKFSVHGYATIVDNGRISANPRTVEWGSAPLLIRSTHEAGDIAIVARAAHDGNHAPAADTLIIRSVEPTLPSCYMDNSSLDVMFGQMEPENGNVPAKKMTEEERLQMLEEVNKQQQEFGIQ